MGSVPSPTEARIQIYSWKALKKKDVNAVDDLKVSLAACCISCRGNAMGAVEPMLLELHLQLISWILQCHRHLDQ